MKKSHIPIIAGLVLALVFFTGNFLATGNYEFILYIGVIVFFAGLILLTDKKVHYPAGTLWGLLIWAVLHMAGGGIQVGDGVLYKWMVLPLSENYPILRFDQVVHAYGFFVATLVMFHIIQPILKKNHPWTALSIVVVMAGLGAGALNEIVEFFATIVVDETGVGDYVNNSLDQVFNFGGAILAMIYIRIRYQKMLQS